MTLKEFRETTNKSWVFGSDYFKQKISDKINRPIDPKKRGADRKSGTFKNKTDFNRV